MAKRDWSLLWRRIAAYLIDVTLLFAIYGVVQSLLFPIVQSAWDLPWETNGWLLELYVLVTISLPVWLYFIGTEQSAWQGSVGKRLVIVYALLIVYVVFVVRSPSQTLYDRWLETAVARTS